MSARGELLAALQRGETLPYAWYSDPEVLRLEQRMIFARSWQYAGRADEVAGPGDCLTCRAGELTLESEHLVAAFQRYVLDAIAPAA